MLCDLINLSSSNNVIVKIYTKPPIIIQNLFMNRFEQFNNDVMNERTSEPVPCKHSNYRRPASCNCIASTVDSIFCSDELSHQVSILSLSICLSVFQLQSVSLSNLPSLQVFFSLCKSISQSSNFCPSLSNLPSLCFFFSLCQSVSQSSNFFNVSQSPYFCLSLFIFASILICQCVSFLISFKISVNLKNVFTFLVFFSLFLCYCHA